MEQVPEAAPDLVDKFIYNSAAATAGGGLNEIAPPAIAGEGRCPEDLNDENAWFEGNRLVFRANAILEGLPEADRLDVHRISALCRIDTGGFLAVTVLETLQTGAAEKRGEREKEPFTVRLNTYRAKRLRALARHLDREPEEVLNLLAFGMPDVEEIEARVNPPAEREEEERELHHAPGFGLKSRHARRIRRMAGLLGTSPRRFLQWQLDSILSDLEDPASGLLEEWAAEMIVYEEDGERERLETAQSASAVEGRAA